MLTFEQYRDKRMSALATHHFLTEMEVIFTSIFEEMMEKQL